MNQYLNNKSPLNKPTLITQPLKVKPVNRQCSSYIDCQGKGTKKNPNNKHITLQNYPLHINTKTKKPSTNIKQLCPSYKDCQGKGTKKNPNSNHTTLQSCL